MAVNRLSEVAARYVPDNQGALLDADISWNSNFGQAMIRAVNGGLPGDVVAYKPSGGAAEFNPDRDHAVIAAITLSRYSSMGAISRVWPSRITVAGISMKLAESGNVGGTLPNPWQVRPGPVPDFTLRNLISWAGLNTTVSELKGTSSGDSTGLDTSSEDTSSGDSGGTTSGGGSGDDSTSSEPVNNTVTDSDSPDGGSADPTTPGGSSTSDPGQLSDEELAGLGGGGTPRPSGGGVTESAGTPQATSSGGGDSGEQSERLGGMLWLLAGAAALWWFNRKG